MPKRILWMLVCLLAAGPALAADGVILINHARALAGGVTTGDTAGYPVTLSLSGHYKLTGNLTAPDQNTHVIQITADDVLVDLGGFKVGGSNVCTPTTYGVTTPCSAPGSGNGIDSSNGNIQVRNGLVNGVGNVGINLTGIGYVLRSVAVVNSGSHGFSTGFNSLYYDAAAGGNGGNGFNLSSGNSVLNDTGAGQNGGSGVAGGAGVRITNGGFSVNAVHGVNLGDSTNLTNVAANSNGSNGIVVGLTSRISGCSAASNVGTGIAFGTYNGVTGSGFTGCVITNNGATVTPATTGTTIGVDAEWVELGSGTNICGLNTTCP